MSHNAATLFDAASPTGDESLLLDDLVTLVALGLLEERSTPNGPVFALTELGREVPEFGSD
jgi:hypothetical protein